MSDFNDELSVRSDPIRVRCYTLSDRIGHAIFCSAGDAPPIELLRSVEGDSRQDNPPSGPMQEMVAESTSIGKPPALMGLGSAGKSHWSCSIEADTTISAVAFDFACKTRNAQWLGSTYQLAAGWTAALVSEQTLQLTRTGAPALALRVLGDGRLRWDAPQATVAIVAAEVAADAPVAIKSQRRWRYAVGLADNLIFDSERGDETGRVSH